MFKIADLAVKQSNTKSLQEIKVTSLRDSVSATCNLVRKHLQQVLSSNVYEKLLKNGDNSCMIGAAKQMEYIARKLS